MWDFDATTSQNQNAATVQKIRWFRERFLKLRKPSKKGKNNLFSVHENKDTLLWILVLFDILHEVSRLTVKHFANLVKRIHRKMLDGVGADCGYCRRTDAGSLCQLFLCHLANCEHYFYFEFNHKIIPLF